MSHFHKQFNSYVIQNSHKVPPFKKFFFKRMLTLACEGIFMYKNKFYKQCDGVAMGIPLGPSLANFFLGHLETTYFQNNKHFPQFYCRYVDDIFAVFQNEYDIDQFFQFINSVHPSMKFTKEMASENSSFPFLNVEIKINNNTFDSWIYRKPTNTNVFLNYKATAPNSYKRGLILCLLTTAKRLSSSNAYFYTEVCKLRDMFSANSYPVSFFNKILNEFLNNESSTVNESSEDYVILKIPFVGNSSFEFSKKLRQTLAKKFSKPIKVVFTTFKVGQCFTLKSGTPKSLLSNVIYKYTCRHDAEVFYVGKTKRHLITRIDEHLSPEGTSEVTKHISECPYCSQANIDSFEILKKTNSNFDCVISESLLIKKLHPPLNKQLFQSGSFYTLKVY